jgi:hypothetical protein
MRKLPALIAAAVVVVSSWSLSAARPPDSWDGLLLVKSQRLENVYLLPHADFRAYTKVMLDPTEVSFKKNWQRNQNSSSRDLGGRISDSDARQILDEAKRRFDQIFADSFRSAGYQIVDQPGEDVVRITTAIINLDVQAPERMTAGRTRTYSREAGQATLVLQAKDSVTGQVLGRAIDAQWAGDSQPYLRNRVTNIADFENLFTRWARVSTRGLDELKALSPIDADGIRRR